MNLYPSIDTQKAEIRLLRLAPGRFDDPIVVTLQTACFEREPATEYVALSYVWGKEICPASAVINGCAVSITANLDSALRHIRHEIDHVILWVDAICINQNDTGERNHQVQLMARIYSSAKRVLVWLGPSADGSDNVFESIKQRGSSKTQAPSFMASLGKLCQRPWFRRVWVVQEFALAKRDPDFVCGFSTVSWTELYSFVRLVHSHLEPRVSPPSSLHHSDFRWLKVVLAEVDSSVGTALTETAGQLYFLHETRNKAGKQGFSAQFYRTRHFEATDPRDKVFAILSLCSFQQSPRTILPDYSKSVSEVFAEAMAVVILESPDFGYSRLPLPYYQFRPWGMDLPSWVPDMQYLRETRPQCCHPYNPAQLASRTLTSPISFSGDFRSLYAGGVIVATVKQTLELKELRDILSYRRLLRDRPMELQEGHILEWVKDPNFGYAEVNHDLSWFSRMAAMKVKAGNDDEALLGHIRDFFEVLSTQVNLCDHPRTVFLTDNGKIGVSPAEIKREDYLVELSESASPFVLRRSTPFWTMVNRTSFLGNLCPVALPQDLGYGKQRIGFQRFEIR
ncbi:hypothetical protein OQA88_7155 [Cercophora sp. LCS_1]